MRMMIAMMIAVIIAMMLTNGRSIQGGGFTMEGGQQCMENGDAWRSMSKMQ